LCAVAGSHGGLVIVQFPLARATRIISSGRFRLRRAQLRQIGRPSTYPPGKLPCHGAAATGQFRRAFALAADADAHQLALASLFSSPVPGYLLREDFVRIYDTAPSTSPL